MALQFILLVGMWSLFGISAIVSRNQARQDAVRSLSNLAGEQATMLSHNIDLLDRSLQEAANGWRDDEIRALKPTLRHLVLFDASLSTERFGPVVILDPYGSVMARSDKIGPANGSYADLDVFRAHVDNPDPGLRVGTVVTDADSGDRSLPVSRRLTTTDGGFAGVVAGSVRLSNVQDAYRRVDLQPGGLLALLNFDGVLLAREPALGHLAWQSVPRIPHSGVDWSLPGGSFEATSALDGIEKLYSYQRVGDLRLVQFAALPLAVVYGEWRDHTLIMGSLLALLTVGVLILQTMLARELRFRIKAERMLEILASQDPLTGIANRRVFDAALDREWRSAISAGRTIGLLMIDVDHFKLYNDRYGHLAGDRILRQVAQALSAVADRHRGLACRYGGEEFALLLPAMSDDGDEIGRDIVQDIYLKALPHSASPQGIVTVSVGVVASVPAPADTAQSLIETADRNLYRAKAAGRNRCLSTLDEAPDVAA